MKKLLDNIEKQLNEVKVLLQDETAEFITNAEYDNSDDVLHELPRIYEVTKHGFFIEFAVLRIDKGKIYLGGLSDDFGELKEATLDELNQEEILAIANQIYQM